MTGSLESKLELKYFRETSINTDRDTRSQRRYVFLSSTDSTVLACAGFHGDVLTLTKLLDARLKVRLQGIFHIDGLVQDCSISSALAMEILQSCTKPLIYLFQYFDLIFNSLKPRGAIWRHSSGLCRGWGLGTFSTLKSGMSPIILSVGAPHI